MSEYASVCVCVRACVRCVCITCMYTYKYIYCRGISKTEHARRSMLRRRIPQCCYRTTLAPLFIAPARQQVPGLVVLCRCIK